MLVIILKLAGENGAQVYVTTALVQKGELEQAKLQEQSEQGSYQNSVQGNGEKVGDLSEANTNLKVLDRQIADTETYIKNLENKISAKKAAKLRPIEALRHE